MSTGLAAMLMNPAKKKGGKKKGATKRRTHKSAGTLPKAPNQGKKKSKSKAKGKSKNKKPKRRKVVVVTPDNRIRKLPAGSRLRFTHRPKIKKLKKKSAQRITKAQRRALRKGVPLKLHKGKRTVTGMLYRSNPPKRRHKRRSQGFLKNPMKMNMKQILGFAGGAAAAILVHKYGVLTLGNLLAKLPVVGPYAAKINENKFANMAAKAALAGGVYFAGRKAKNDNVKNAAKA